MCSDVRDRLRQLRIHNMTYVLRTIHLYILEHRLRQLNILRAYVLGTLIDNFFITYVYVDSDALCSTTYSDVRHRLGQLCSTTLSDVRHRLGQLRIHTTYVLRTIHLRICTSLRTSKKKKGNIVSDVRICTYSRQL